MKVSLHASGICQFGFTEHYYNSLAAEGITRPDSRAWIRWRRPPTPDRGAALALSIFFPSDYLRGPALKGAPKKPIFVIESAPAGHAIEIGLFYSREDPEQVRAKLQRIGTPLTRSGLPNGDSIWLVARSMPFVLPKEIRQSEKWIRKIHPIGRDWGLEPGDRHSGLTGIFHNEPKDGQVLQLLEIGGITVSRRP